jgi:26S proteasome regulatory subunit N3
VEAHAAAFARHGTLSLVRRLDANVIRAGLRRVASAYSCIRFADVAVKLRLGSAEDAEFLCAKAVRDGVLVPDLGYVTGRAPTDRAFRGALDDEICRMALFLGAQPPPD